MSFRTILFILLLVVISNVSAQEGLSAIVPIEIQAEVKSLSHDTISLSRSEFLTYSGSFDDPSRLLLKHAGFSTANDQANFIIQDGLPPHYVKWSLHGAEILNPNHLANAGSLTDNNSASAGGVNMFSGQVLGSMNFYSPSSPKAINNIGGVADLKLREPHDSRYHINFSLIGMEIGGDRIIPDTDDNFMINYRYSTVGLLTKMGLDFGDEEIVYQDLVTSLKLKDRALGDYTFYASIGGSSTIHYAIEDSLVKSFKDLINSDFKSKIFIFGLHQKQTKDRYSFENTFNFSKTTTKAHRTLKPYISSQQSLDLGEHLYSIHSKISLNRGPNKFIGGAMINHYRYDPFSTNWHFTFTPYVSWNKLFANIWAIQIGLKAMGETFSPYGSDQPSLEINFQPSIEINRIKSNWSMMVRYSRNEQMQTLDIYNVIINGYKEVLSTGLSNAHLKNTIADHFSFELKNTFVGARLFYHRLKNIPAVDSDTFFFSDLISQDYIPFSPLTNAGKARIYGISLSTKLDLSVFTLIGNATFQDGKQSIGSSKDVHIPYDFGYIANLVLDKKITISNTKYLGFNLSFHVRGGAWESKVKESFLYYNFTEYEASNPYSVQLSDYFRADLRIIYVKKSKTSKYKSVISLDVQNITNRQNDAFHYFDPLLEKVSLQKQLGIIPILGWRVEF